MSLDSFLCVSDVRLLTELLTGCVRVEVRFTLTLRAALSRRSVHPLTVGQVISLNLVTQDGSAVTHADPAGVWLPDVFVGVRLTVLRAALVISCGQNKRTNVSN